MHEMPDTESADAAAERFWPEGYKQKIRDGVARRVADRLREAGAFEKVYEHRYATALASYTEFVGRVAEIVAIGAENGTDQAFDAIHAALRTGTPLPTPRLRARYLWPEPFDDHLGDELHRDIVAEYRESHTFQHLHEDHSSGDLIFEEFVGRVADLVVAGGVNGADDALAAVYRALLAGSPLPPARRRPRRIR
jgi:hypothetical protein